MHGILALKPLRKPVHFAALNVDTMILRGLDSFLLEVRKIIQTKGEKDDELLPGVVLS